MKVFKGICFSILMLCLLSLSEASAAFLGFEQITEGDESGVASQLQVEITDLGCSQVLLWFTNNGSIESVITGIYFYDGSLLGINSIIDNDDIVSGYVSSDGVDFSVDAKPDHLPGYNEGNATRTFLADEVVDSADSDPSPIKNGISNTGGEYLGIIFNLIDGQEYEDLIEELYSGDVVIGLHVQAVADAEGTSLSFVNAVPVPAGIWLLGSGLFCIVGSKKIRRKKS